MDINQVGSAAAAQQIMSQQRPLKQTPAAESAAEDKTLASQALSAYGAAKDQVQIRYSTTSKNLETVRAIEQMHASLNQLVKGVRETNEGLNKTAEKMDQMQSRLQTIVKNYPPFASDSQERQKILMSYTSIRKEIEHMMVPPPPSQIYEKVKKMWEGLFDEQGKVRSAATPDLNVSSSDRQVSDAAAVISSSSDQVAALSNSITSALIQS